MVFRNSKTEAGFSVETLITQPHDVTYLRIVCYIDIDVTM
jgi:hypothetical protein